jgi:hypothetical protein
MYNYRLSYVSTAAGETHVAVVYADTGIALVAQPAYNIRDLGAGAYLYVTAAMPDGQGGAVAITNGGVLVALAVVSPQETENADEKVSQVAADITAAHGAGLYTGGFPNPPGTHRLSGFEQDAGGNPVDGSVIKATVVSTPHRGSWKPDRRSLTPTRLATGISTCSRAWNTQSILRRRG